MELKNLFLDFDANRETVKGKDLASTTGLEEQYSKLADNSLDEFLARLCKDDLTVFVSIPNFNRDITETSYGKFYNNCAIRMEFGDRDLVLLGDILEQVRRETLVVQRSYKVKSILFMDKSVKHYGEIEQTVKPFIRIHGKWQVSDGTQYPGIYDEFSKLNLFSDSFMIELKETSPVPKASEAERKLHNWAEFLKSRKDKLDQDCEDGYELYCEPDFAITYVTPSRGMTREEIGAIPDKLEFVNRDDVICTSFKYNEKSEEKLLAHMVVGVPRPEYYAQQEKKKNSFKKQLDSFTRDPCILAFPGDKMKNGLMRAKVRFNDRRFSNSYVCEEEPIEKYAMIDENLKIKIAQSTQRSTRRRTEEIKKRMEAYESGPLVEILEDYRDKNRLATTKSVMETIRKEIQKRKNAINSRIDALSKRIEKDEVRLKELVAEDSRLVEKIAVLKESMDDVDNPTNKEKKDLKNLDSKLKKCNDERKSLDVAIQDAKKTVAEFTAELEGVEASFNVDNEVNAALEKKVQNESTMLLERQRGIFRSEVNEEMEPELQQEIGYLRAEADEEKEAARINDTMVLLHFYFEVESEGDENLYSKLKSLEGLRVPGLKLYKDLTGNSIILKRQWEALENLVNGNAMNPFLIPALFAPSSNGKSTVMKSDDPRLEGLNESQKQVVTKALASNGLFLIQGPPGTGKTEVIARIASILAEDGKKVLISSENNKAVDNAFKRLAKVPSVRPVRLIRDKDKRKDNMYSPENLVKNFYNNICLSLGDEIEKYDDYEKFIDKIYESIESLTSYLVQIDKLGKKAQDTSQEIKGIEDEIGDVYEKINKNNNENKDMDAKIEEMNESLSKLADLNDESMIPVYESVGDRFGLDCHSDEYAELVSRLIGKETAEIAELWLFYEQHSPLVELCKQKSAIPDNKPDEILKKGGEIKAYEAANGVDHSQLAMFMLFPGDVPSASELNHFRSDIEEAIDKKKREIDKKVNVFESMRSDNSALEQRVRNLNIQLENLKTDKTYQLLNDVKHQFDEERNAAFKKLHIKESSKDRSVSLQMIKNEIERLSYVHRNEENISERVNTYRRICKYVGDEDVMDRDYDRYASEIFKNVNVIGMTCTAGNRTSKEDEFTMDLRNQNIDVVIIDEVSKVSFVELIQPILLGKTVILVGDHKQLPPMYNKIPEEEISRYNSEYISLENEERFKAMYETSFFNELFEKSPDSVKDTLTIQYRMHTDIMDIDNEFYRDHPLTFGGNEVDKEHRLTVKGASGRNIITPETHVIFIDTRGREFKESGSSSYTNNDEAEVVSKLLMMINDSCRYDSEGNKLGYYRKGEKDKRLSAGVICTYADQTSLIKRNVRGKKFESFKNDPEERFMVKSVDDFQGDERDIIILSTVRSRKNCQFLAKFNRINVAVSRARRLLIIVGNPDALEKTRVEIDGRSTYVYSDMISAIRRKGGYLTSSDILGGGN